MFTVGGSRGKEFKIGGHMSITVPEKNVVVSLHFLALQVQLVVLVSVFVMGRYYSLVSFLFAVLLLTVPSVPSHL